jgi:alpha-tubulin suppressor-like RCC1 family protein
MSLGYNHSSAVSSTGRVFTWGGNQYGQLGNTTTSQRLLPTEITSRFQLFAGEIIVGISLGSNFFSNAVSSTGRVFIWGRGESVKLGDETTNDKLAPTEVTYTIESSIFLSTEEHQFGETINELTLSTPNYFYSSWYDGLAPTTPFVFTAMPDRDLNLYILKTPND